MEKNINSLFADMYFEVKNRFIKYFFIVLFDLISAINSFCLDIIFRLAFVTFPSA